jgi:hypothetical protein
VLGEDTAEALRLIQRNGVGTHVTINLHAQRLGEVTQDLNFEFGAKSGFERRQPRSIIAYGGNVVLVECDNGNNGPGAEDIDARVRDGLLPSILDKLVSQEDVELTGVGLF